jgi:heme-degrading monooxygenase HmoA
MIIELATLEVGADRAEEFAKAFPDVQAVLSRAQGFVSGQLLDSLERPGRFVLLAHWSTLEDHTERFLGSELFQEFEAIVRPFLKQPPDVQHFHISVAS